MNSNRPLLSRPMTEQEGQTEEDYATYPTISSRQAIAALGEYLLAEMKKLFQTAAVMGANQIDHQYG